MKFGWRSALGILLSVLLLAFTLRGVNFGDVAQALRSSSLPLFLLATVVGTLIFPLRARRWKTILSPIDDQIPDRKSTRLNSSHGYISYAVFCLKKKKNTKIN